MTLFEMPPLISPLKAQHKCLQGKKILSLFGRLSVSTPIFSNLRTPNWISNFISHTTEESGIFENAKTIPAFADSPESACVSKHLTQESGSHPSISICYQTLCVLQNLVQKNNGKDEVTRLELRSELSVELKLLHKGPIYY